MVCQVCSRYALCSRGEVSLPACYLALLQFQEALLATCMALGSKGRAAASIRTWVHKICSQRDCQGYVIVKVDRKGFKGGKRATGQSWV